MKNKSNLIGAKNLGKTIILRLNNVGIYNLSDIKKKGVLETYLALCRSVGKKLPVCYYLYSLEGALIGKHWDKIGDKKKKEFLTKIKNYGN